MIKNSSVSTKVDGNEKAAKVILDFIGQFGNLTDEERSIIAENLDPTIFKKGAYLLKEGQIPKGCFFLISGCVRQFYLKDGEERTTNFFLEGESIDPVFHADPDAPSKFYLQCIEECILTVNEGYDEQEMYKQFPKFETICRAAVETKLSEANEQMSSFIISSPEERYLNLMKNRPELLNRVPQYQLASYLGMKPESLSRIRKRILEKSKEA